MNEQQENIKDYYDELAKDYDQDRFANSYGRYIHQQEIHLLGKYLDAERSRENLDIACGTGRLLQYADYGVDISEEMLRLARQKYPSKLLAKASITQLPFEDKRFNNATCFHLFMHLNKSMLREALAEVHRVLKEGAYFIFDIPSEQRRKLLNYKAQSWHGAYQISPKKLQALLGKDWELVAYHGIAFFPIHRLPKAIRRAFIPLDNFFAGSWLRAYSSHITYILRKR